MAVSDVVWQRYFGNEEQNMTGSMSETMVSDYSRRPEVLETLDFPSQVYIVDSTIRSLQSGVSGSCHTAEDLIRIGVALDDLGVRELIVNLSWKFGFEVCAGLASEDLQARIVGTFRARHPQAENWAWDGVSAGADEICFESAADGEQLKRLAEPLRSRNHSVSHGFAEAYSYEEVIELCRLGTTLQMQSQSFHDSFFRFGITPEAIKFFYRSVLADVPSCPPLYVHLSNFYGNAAMTAVAALAAGATAPDVCLNGIGHHCGHISLAEVAMVLEALYDVRTGLRLEKLHETSQLVQQASQISLPLPSPVTGDFAFMTDGAYWAAEAHLPYEERIHAKFPIPPGMVGNQEQVIWGDGTITSDSVKAKLKVMGVDAQRITDEVAERIIAELGAALRSSDSYPSWMLDADFEGLCHQVLAGAEAR